jgi:predicted transcriptional regulator
MSGPCLQHDPEKVVPEDASMSSESTAGKARNENDEPYVNKRLADLSAFQRDILWVLSHCGPLKGLAIKSNLQDYYQEDINHGQLYPNLDELVERGLVDKGKQDQRTNEYTLTADGKQALSRRRTWTEAGEVTNV